MTFDAVGYEHAVLSALMADNTAIRRVRLSPDDFSDRRNRKVFASIQRLIASGVSADPVTLQVDLGILGTDASVYVLDVYATNASSDNVEFYADAIRGAARRQRFLSGLERVIADAKRDDSDGGDIRDRVQAFLALSSGEEAQSGTPLSEVVAATYGADYAAVMAGRASDDFVPTGIAELDAQLGGVSLGVVTVIGGRPSMGKSALARTLALNAVTAGHGAHVFSLEDNRSAYARRCLSDWSGVELSRVVQDIRDPRLERAARFGERYARLIIEDEANISSSQIAQRVRERVKSNGTKLVVVDYVQVVQEPEAKRDEARLQVKIAIENLAKLARTEGIAVVVVSQLSRLVESRPDKRPTLADLREAGELEQVANVVLMCYRDEYYNPQTKRRGIGEVIVAKNKHGSTGTVDLAWDAATATYRSRFRSTVAREPGSDDE